jgi:hypothetical protein
MDEPLVARPDSFLVSSPARLEPHGAERARAWAAKLAEMLVPAR